MIRVSLSWARDGVPVNRTAPEQTWSSRKNLIGVSGKGKPGKKIFHKDVDIVHTCSYGNVDSDHIGEKG